MQRYHNILLGKWLMASSSLIKTVDPFYELMNELTNCMAKSSVENEQLEQHGKM